MDPLEEYLAKKQQPAAADPLAAYLAKKAEAPPQRPQGFVDRLKFAVQHPIESVKDEVRLLGENTAPSSNVLDKATLGGYRQIRDAHSVKEALLGGGQASAQTKGEERWNAEHPFTANATEAAGYMMGAPRMIAEAAGAGLKFAAGTLPQMIARGLGRAAPAVTPAAKLAASEAAEATAAQLPRPIAAGVTGGVTQGGTQAAEDVAHGAPIDIELAKRSGRAALMGTALGAGSGTIGAGGSKVAKAIRNPKTLTGRAIADAEAAGGRIKAVGEPVQGGMYDEQRMQDLPKGKAGYNQLAYEEGQNITAHNEDKLSGARRSYGSELADILHGNSDDVHFTVDTHNMLDRLADENTVNGVTGDPHLQSAIDKVRQMLTSDMPARGAAPQTHAEPPPVPQQTRVEPVVRDERFWRNAEREWSDKRSTDIGHKTVGDKTNPGGRGPLPSDEPAAYAKTEVSQSPGGGEWPAATVPDLIKTKRIVDSLAEHGMPATAENRPYRMISSSLARELEAVDPRISELNKRYAGQMSDLERANDIVYGSNKPEIASRAAKERRAAGFLGRIGDDTQAGTAAEPQLRELSAMDPAYEQSIQRVKAKKAQERLRYGFPEVSTNIEKAGHSFVKQNLDAVKARVALPIAEAAGRIGPSPISLMYLPEAVRLAVEARRRMENR